MTGVQTCALPIWTDKRDTNTIASDQQIKLSIRGKLFNNSDTSLYNVSVESFYGDVYIIGTYNDKIEVNESIRLAKETDGVKNVQTYMVQKVDKEDCGMTSSTTMLLDIKNRFAKDEQINPTKINVHVVQ